MCRLPKIYLRSQFVTEHPMPATTPRQLVFDVITHFRHPAPRYSVLPQEGVDGPETPAVLAVKVTERKELAQPTYLLTAPVLCCL